MSSNKTFFSVIIPTHNREKLLPRAVDSVLNQSFSNFELIIVDDCSTDNSNKYLHSISKKNKKVTIIKTDTNKGVSHARNLGVSISQSNWVTFLDSDDEWLPFKLQKQYEYILNHKKAQLIHSNEIWIKNGVRINQHNKHKKSGGDIFNRSLNFCIIAPSTVAINKQTWNKYGPFDEEMTVCEDYDLWLKISLTEQIDFINDILIKKYGGHSDQLSTRYVAMDYYRVKSMINLIIQRKSDFTEEKLLETKNIIDKKYQILCKGYNKHNRQEELNNIQKLYNSFNKS